MTAPLRPVVGLSVGSTSLVAVGPDRSVTRPPVVTRAGAPIGDFVDRVGDPVGIVAADGTLHPAAALLAEACADLAHAAVPGPAQAPRAVIAHPAHWTPTAVEAFHRALRRLPHFGDALLVPDFAAAVSALSADGRLPRRGVIAVCDVGATATTVTLVDAGKGFAAVGPSLRYPDFCGDLIDQAVLAHVLGQAGPAPGATGTAAIGPLIRLRGQCRAAKERLSAVTVTALPVEVAGFHGDMRLTRAELDEMMRAPLAGMAAAVQDLLVRNGISARRLTAVASVGGGAAIPAVTAALSQAFRVPVVTTACPMLAAATGAALRATRPDPVTTALAEPEAPEPPAVAWSHAVDVPALTPPAEVDKPAAQETSVPRPRVDFAPGPAAQPVPARWHRRPLVVAAVTLAVIAGAGAATALALRTEPTAAPVSPSPSITTTGQPPAAESVTAEAGAPPRRTVIATPAPEPPAPVVDAPQAPAPVAGPPPVETMTVVSTPPPVTETVTTEAPPPPPPEPPPAPAWTPPPLPPLPTITIPAIPGLPPLFSPSPG